MKLVETNGTAVLLAKIEGEYSAIGSKCTHTSCKLSSGKLKGEHVKCPCHGSKFNVKTGEAVHGNSDQIGVKVHGKSRKVPDFSRSLTIPSLFCRSNDCE